MIWSKNKMNFTHAPVRMIRRFFNMNQVFAEFFRLTMNYDTCFMKYHFNVYDHHNYFCYQ